MYTHTSASSDRCIKKITYTHGFSHGAGERERDCFFFFSKTNGKKMFEMLMKMCEHTRMRMRMNAKEGLDESATRQSTNNNNNNNNKTRTQPNKKHVSRIPLHSNPFHFLFVNVFLTFSHTHTLYTKA